MAAARAGHSATLLAGGTVLIAGGDGPPPTGAGRTAETYDPATGTFSSAGSMNQPRANHSAVLLPSGQVLIVGPDATLGAELYDPATRTFHVTGTTQLHVDVQSAALLASGKVLVAGSTGAALYDPSTATFQAAGAYTAGFIATDIDVVALPDGRALVLGRAPAQLYDPARNAFSSTGSPSSPGVSGDLYSATLLADGRVLVAGGMDVGRSAAAALYDPRTGSFVLTDSLRVARDAQAAVRLLDGRVLVVGGDGQACTAGACWFVGSVAAAELYEPATQRFTSVGNTVVARTAPAATVLVDGDVLITGGFGFCGIGCSTGATATAEIYHPQ